MNPHLKKLLSDKLLLFLLTAVFALFVIEWRVGGYGDNPPPLSGAADQAAAILSVDQGLATSTSPNSSPAATAQEPKRASSFSPLPSLSLLLSPTQTPTASPSATPLPVSPALASPVRTPSPTPSPFVTPLPTPTPTPTPQPTPSPTPTASSDRVVINEIGWMGTAASFADEWIELFNPGPESVELGGWKLRSADGSPDITFPTGTLIAASGYLLIERTDDTTIGDIAADLATSFGRGGLNNDGEILELINAQGAVVDKVGDSQNDGAAGAWYAGTNDPRASMERIRAEITGNDPGNWRANDGLTANGRDSAGNPVRGTPRQKNSQSI